MTCGGGGWDSGPSRSGLGRAIIVHGGHPHAGPSHASARSRLADAARR